MFSVGIKLFVPIEVNSTHKKTNKMDGQSNNITRREAVKKLGTVVATTALSVSGLGALASCAQVAAGFDRKLKVLLLNGSPRRNGNTFTMLSEIEKQLQKNGIESEIFQLGNRPVRGCVACGQCHAKNLDRCVFDDDVCNQIAEKLAVADALVVGSPVYYGMPAGQVLSVLQRLGYCAGKYMQGKPAAAVTVCRRGGATSAFQALQMAFQMLNMPIVTSQYWNIGYGSAPGEVSKDEEGMQTMRTLADNLAYMLLQFATGTAALPKREPWKTTNFIR